MQSIYIQFVCEFALENARNAVVELQKCKTPHPPFLRKLSVTVQINHKKALF
jgi:hypothetical protein